MATEAALRRRAKKLGWRVETSRKDFDTNHQGLFQLIDDTNTVRAGVNYDAELDEIEQRLAEEEQRRA